MHLLARLLVILTLNIGVLDCKAPDVEVITDGDDDVDDKAAIDTDGHAQHAEHEGHLVDIITQSTGPAGSPANVSLKQRADRVNNTPGKWNGEHVPVRERQLDEMRSDHLTNRVGIDKTSKDDKRHQVLGADHGLQPEVGHDEGPSTKEGNKSEQSTPAAVASSPASLDDVSCRLDSVEDEHDGALDHVPLSKVQLVDGLGDAPRGWHAKGRQHALLPEARAAHVARQCVDANENQHTFDRTVYYAERQGLGVIFVPGLRVEGAKRGKEDGNRVPRVTHVLRGSENEHLERSVEGVNAVVKELAERSRLVSASPVSSCFVSLGVLHRQGKAQERSRVT